MKKLFIFLPIMFIASLVFPNNISFFKTEKAVDKQVQLAVFSDNDYNTDAYNDAKATIEITVLKVRGNKQTVVSKKQFKAIQLRNVPQAGKALQSSITVPNVLDSKETIVISYAIIYNSNGSKIKFENDEVLAKGNHKSNVKINI